MADCLPPPPGESVDDCGGGYSESIAEICEELQNGLTPLLIVTPNGRDESGANRDCYLFSPAARASVHTNMFRFLGALPHGRGAGGRPCARPRPGVCCVWEGPSHAARPLSAFRGAAAGPAGAQADLGRAEGRHGVCVLPVSGAAGRS